MKALIFAHKIASFSLVNCKINDMKALRSIITIFLLSFALAANSQYYYKDLLVTRQSMQQLQQFKATKVKAVKLTSYEANGVVTEDFAGEQSVNNNYTVVTTFTKSRLSDSSELTTFYNSAGQLIKTVDSTDGFKSTTEYSYDNNNRLTNITNNSASTGQATEKEQHIWSYNAKGIPEKMLKIKNNVDTTYITFVGDEKGNVIEEHSIRKGRSLPSYYYYYDDNNRLTDIVRYNERAQRLLPDYVFEYDEEGRVSTVIIVPEQGSDYEKWFYSYYENGLKGQEACYNKRQELQGRIEYQYTF
jgi:YD repeat-containing protein